MDDVTWPQAAMAFAIAFAAVGVFWAAGAADKGRQTTEYWHYRHHQGAGVTSDCNSSCNFIRKTQDK